MQLKRGRREGLTREENAIAKFREAILDKRLQGWKLKQNKRKHHHPRCLPEPFRRLHAVPQGHQWEDNAITTSRPQPTPPRSANYLPGLILQLARQFQQLATARNKGFWKKDTPTVSQGLDPGPESANPFAHGGSSLVAFLWERQLCGFLGYNSSPLPSSLRTCF